MPKLSGESTSLGEAGAAGAFMTERELGLPQQVRACLFDLDGVLTKTAEVHARAWERMFDAFLRTRCAATGEAFVGFDLVRDYEVYVDGKPRDEGTRSFLASRGIQIPEGRQDDPSTADTIHGLGKRKNEILLSLLRQRGVQVYDGSARYLKAVREAGLGRRRVVE